MSEFIKTTACIADLRCRWKRAFPSSAPPAPPGSAQGGCGFSPTSRARILLAALLLVVFSSVGCSTPPAATTRPPDTVERIVNSGTIRVGYLVFAPAVVRDDRTGDLTGIFPEMVGTIADALGVNVEWVETSLSNFAAGLISEQFDFSVGPTFVTIPRAAAVSFTAPVAYVGNAGIVATDSSLRPERIDDLNVPGVRVAVLQGQALEEYASRHLPSVDLLVLSGGNLSAPLAAVSAGQADVGLMNAVTVSQYVSEHPEVRPILMDRQVEILPLAWATRRNDEGLRTFLDASILYLQATGRVAEAQRRQSISLLYAPQLLQLPE